MRHNYQALLLFITSSLRLGGPGTCWQGNRGIYFPFLSPFCKTEGRTEPSHCHCLMFFHLTITHFHVTWKGLATGPERKSLLVQGRSLKIGSLRAGFVLFWFDFYAHNFTSANSVILPCSCDIRLRMQPDEKSLPRRTGGLGDDCWKWKP